MNPRHPRPNWTHATHAIYLADSTTRNEISDEVEKHAKPEITLNKLKSICCNHGCKIFCKIEAAFRRCTTKRMFLNFSQNSEENTCAEVFLITLERLATLLEKRLWHKCFSVSYTKFLRRTCLENTFRRFLLERMQKTTKQLVKTANHNKVTVCYDHATYAF